MGVNDWSAAEKDLYAIGMRALFDDMERYRQELSQGVALDTSSTDAMLRDQAARTAAMQAETRAYIASLYDGDGPAPAQEPQDQAVGASAAAGSSSPAMPGGGPGPGQHPITDADIASMSMQEYQAFRARIGMTRASGRGLFG